jgi:hypothetical protein
MSVANVLYCSVPEVSDIDRSGNSSGACHLSVPVVLFVDMDVITVGLESLAVARPKSARQALRDCETNMLTWSVIVRQPIYNTVNHQLTPLRSPWMMFSLCRYSRPCATSSDCRKQLVCMYPIPKLCHLAHQKYTIHARSLVGQELYYIAIFHPGTCQANPRWIPVQMINTIEW